MNLLFFDTETTSLEKDCRLIQLAILGDETDEHILVEANPGVPISLDAMATHHITNKMVEHRKKFDRQDMIQKLADQNIFVAHNAAYDIMVMKNEGVEIKKFICTKKVAQDLLDLPKYNLQYLRYYFDLDLEGINPHDALSDCVVLKHVFRQLANGVQMKYKLFDDLEAVHQKMIEISERPVLLRRIGFGKHNGTEFSKIPKDYLDWLSKQENVDEDLQYTINFYLNGKSNQLPI